MEQGLHRASTGIKKIPDDESIQVLWQQLLHAEAAVAKRKQKSNGQKVGGVKDSDIYRTPRKPTDQQDEYVYRKKQWMDTE